MGNNTNKEKWIDEVLNSTKGMSRAIPGADILGSTLAKSGALPPVKTFLIPIKPWAAAAILLLAVNVGSVIYFTSRNKIADAASPGNPVAVEMQTVSTYNY